MPVYNEAGTITTILNRILSVRLVNGIKKELIIVNDCSTDDTEKLVREFILEHPGERIKFVTQPQNLGKGAAIHKGIELATGDYVIIQDADLEYDPKDYNLLLQPVIDEGAEVVYGSRFIGENPNGALFYGHRFGNRVLTAFSNMVNHLSLTDMETCYKLVSAKLIRSVHLEQHGFGFEPELTSKLAGIKGLKFYEVAISYHGRSYKDGKKIKWKDGVNALYCILKYGLFK